MMLGRLHARLCQAFLVCFLSLIRAWTPWNSEFSVQRTTLKVRLHHPTHFILSDLDWTADPAQFNIRSDEMRSVSTM